MASRNFHKNRTNERKRRQATQRRIKYLQERVMRLAGMQPMRVARMTLRELEHADRKGGRLRMVTPMDGIALALAASSLGARR